MPEFDVRCWEQYCRVEICEGSRWEEQGGDQRVVEDVIGIMKEVVIIQVVVELI